ncbi:MAG TPA: carboxymuconolactone decarboxylase family protein [Acidimicrobiales bacterium]|nr:carboxymuconolactone decarboxylase family protein [Acidimicrobiales bacterium]
MRIDYTNVFPAALAAMAGLEQAVHSSSLEPELLELVKLRASQINGCGYCVDMHSKDAKGIGIDDQRLNLVVVWPEAPNYSSRERAALAWCETLTTLSSTGASDDVYEKVASQFTPEEIVALTLAVVAINGWNRFAVGLRSPVGNYVSPHKTHS